MPRKSLELAEALRLITLSAGVLLSCVVGLSGSAGASPESEKSRASYEEARTYVDDGDLRAAVIELKNALQSDPQNAEARLLLGRVYVRLGDGASAEKELRAARRNGIAMEQIAVDLGRAMLLQRHFEDVLKELDPAAYSPKTALELELQRAQAHGGLGRPEEARRGFEKIVKDHPEEPSGHLGLAELDLQARQFVDAEANAAAALALAPDLAAAVLIQAEARRLRGEPGTSLSLYRQVIEASPQPTAAGVQAHLGLAAALIGLARDEEAEAELKALEPLAPRVPLAAYLQALIKVRGQDFRAAREILDAAAPSLEDYGPAQLLRGVVHFEAGELEIARSWLSRHLNAQPENLQARKLFAATLLRLNSVADAIEVLKPAQSQAPADPQVLMLLGNAYVRSGRAAEATDLFQQAVELAPGDPRVLGQLAISHFVTGDYDQSAEALTDSLDLNPDASALGFALAFMHLRAGSFDEALRISQKLRAHFPESAMAANLEGGAYAALGQLTEARASFEAVLAMDPDFHQARANLAALKASAGDIAGAEAEYRKILAQDPGNADAMLGLATLASRRGDESEQRQWLEEAVETDPDSPRYSLALAESHAQKGEVASAVDVLSAVDRRRPDDPRVLSMLAQLQARADQFDSAIRTSHRLVNVTGDSADARLLLARSQLAAGRTQAAREVLEATLEVHSEHLPTVEVLLALSHQEGGVESALSYARQLQERYPATRWSGQLVGDVHLRAGNLEQAVAAYEEGWAKQPSAGLALALSRARLRQNAEQAALAPLKEWVESHPADDRVRMALAESLLRLGELEQARLEYEILKETQADNAIIWNNLAWLYQEAGDSRAIAHGEHALALAPNQPAILDTLGWILLEAGNTARARDLLEQAHLGAPDSADIAYHYAVALHEGGEDSAARDILQALLESERSFAAKADAAALLAQLSQ